MSRIKSGGWASPPGHMGGAGRPNSQCLKTNECRMTTSHDPSGCGSAGLSISHRHSDTVAAVSVNGSKRVVLRARWAQSVPGVRPKGPQNRRARAAVCGFTPKQAWRNAAEAEPFNCDVWLHYQGVRGVRGNAAQGEGPAHRYALLVIQAQKRDLRALNQCVHPTCTVALGQNRHPFQHNATLP